MIVWTQIANAFTMISPLVAWWHHRKREKECCALKRLRRTMIVHIPISFLYHLISGLNIIGCKRGFFKVCDLVLVHVYTLQACHMIKQTPVSTMHLPLLLNTYCITRVCRGYEDTKLRMCSLYVCTHDALRKVKCMRSKRRLVALGVSSSMLFYFDNKLMNIGHPLFHVLLGFLHHEILGLVVCSMY